MRRPCWIKPEFPSRNWEQAAIDATTPRAPPSRGFGLIVFVNRRLCSQGGSPRSTDCKIREESSVRRDFRQAGNFLPARVPAKMGVAERHGKRTLVGVFRQAVCEILDVTDRFGATFGAKRNRNFRAFSFVGFQAGAILCFGGGIGNRINMRSGSLIIERWCQRAESNRRPRAYESHALTN